MSSLSMLLLWRHPKPRVGRAPTSRTPHTPRGQHGIKSGARMHWWAEIWLHVELRGAPRRETPTSPSAPSTAHWKARHPFKAQLVVRSSIRRRSKRQPAPRPAPWSSRASHQGHPRPHSASIHGPATATWTLEERSATRSNSTTRSRRRPKVIVKRVGGDQMVNHGCGGRCELRQVGEPRRLRGEETSKLSHAFLRENKPYVRRVRRT